MENISLRDQFAMAAMQGELAGQRDGCEWANEICLANRAYEIADAMLAARDKNSGRLKAIKSAAQNMVNNPQVSVLKSGELILSMIEGYGE